jgi:hypothetical protein
MLATVVPQKEGSANTSPPIIPHSFVLDTPAAGGYSGTVEVNKTCYES